MVKDKLIEHHVKYKEIHGYDETIWITVSEHKKLHERLRRNNKCNIPVDELRKISKSAYARTEKGKETQKSYKNSEDGKKTNEKHKRTNKCKETKARYNKTNIQAIRFFETLELNISLREEIIYNIKTGSVTYTSRFVGGNKKILPIINI